MKIIYFNRFLLTVYQIPSKQITVLSFMEELENLKYKSPLSDLWYSIFETIKHTVLIGALTVTGAISVFNTFIRCTGLKGAGMVKHNSILA